ncbi:hypothetical protein LWI29_017739 [Acer saccharum]|uniref:Uncharacterized protein n=1 Tax=Acer saccharum TaxID=4024 RepID=A0AA39SED8_ACESA|nr:hypothetical protein LWI29_017739 [Acer saccharum]
MNDINHVLALLSEDFLEEIVDENSYLMSSLVSKSSNLAPRNVEVHMFTTGVYKTIDLATLNSYEDLLTQNGSSRVYQRNPQSNKTGIHQQRTNVCN